MSLSDLQIAEIRKKLDQLELELAEDIAQAKKSSGPVELDQQAVGRVSRVDAIQQQQMQASAVRRMEQRLMMVKRAGEKIELVDFGLCAKCEEPIAYERLKARPEAILCISCARKVPGAV